MTSNKETLIAEIKAFSNFSIYNQVLETFKSYLSLDLNISEKDLETNLYTVNNKSSAWLQRYIKYSRYTLLALDILNRVKKSKYHFFKFEYKELKIDRNDIKLYIEADDEYIEAKEIYDNLKHITTFLESAHKKVSELPFTLESIINWKKYLLNKQ